MTANNHISIPTAGSSDSTKPLTFNSNQFNAGRVGKTYDDAVSIPAGEDEFAQQIPKRGNPLSAAQHPEQR
jgi:hypothetical protein